jgi:hypothetical protein
MARPKPTKLTVQQDKFVRMEANGYTTPEIIMELWGMKEADDPKAYHALECKISRWRKHPAYLETWKDEVSANVCVKLMNKGLKKIMHQMDADEQWLANKAANDGVNFARARIFAEEDRMVTVQIDGMPEIGTPDQDG